MSNFNRGGHAKHIQVNQTVEFSDWQNVTVLDSLDRDEVWVCRTIDCVARAGFIGLYEVVVVAEVMASLGERNDDEG